MADDAHGGNRWSRAFTLISAVLAVIGVTATIWSVGPHTLWHQLQEIGPWFGVILALELAGTACDAAALRDFLGESQRGNRVPYWIVLKAYVAGRSVNMVTPLGGLGEGTKATILLQHAPGSRVVAGVVRANIVALLIALTLVAVGAPTAALSLDLDPGLHKLMLIGGAVAALVGIGLVWLIHRGLARTFAAVAGHLRILSKKRRESWQASLEEIDHRLRATRGGSTRAARLRARLRGGVRWVLLSRALGWTSLWITLYAAHHAVSIGFLAVIVTAGVLIGWVASIAPLGLGVTEGANYGLFRALGEDPALGVVMVVARRLVTIIYVIIGLITLATSETAQRVRKKKRS